MVASEPVKNVTSGRWHCGTVRAVTDAGSWGCPREWQMTLHLLSLMPVPDQISFNAGISACNKARKRQMVLYLLSQMTAARVVPNRISFSFNACISACEKAGEWQMTLHLLSLMPEAGVIPDRILFEAGIRACNKADEWQMALDLLSQMPAAGVDPDRQTP
eukprot:s2471_g8.t1